MKLKFIAGVFLAGVLAVGAATTNELSATLQRGLFEEEANHNLDAAIQAYQNVINEYDKDRKLAATAIFRLGECYRKQNKVNQARGQFERIVRDFSDQTILLEMSQKILQEHTGTQTAMARAAAVSEVNEIIVDTPGAEFEGNWSTAKGASNRFGADYKFTSVRPTTIQSAVPAIEGSGQPSAVSLSGRATATFRPDIKVAGNYLVDIWYAQGENRATNAPWLISFDGGEETVFVNQRTNGGKWVSIGSANFSAGTKGFVRLSSDAPNAGAGAGGVVVVADAVRFRLANAKDANTIPDETSQWVNLFNGQDLAGWTGDPNYWSVQDGYITARAGAGAPANLRINLTSKEAVEDFELRLRYRFRQMAGNQNASAGVQYRTSGDSQQPGYLCELTLREENVGMLTAVGRSVVAVLTQRAVIRARTSGQDKVDVVSPLEPFSQIAKSIKEGDWNECVISAQGNHLVHKINGHVVVDVVDENVGKRSLSGRIALQLNTGAKPGVFVQFKDIQLKRMAADSTAASASQPATVNDETLAHLEKLRIDTQLEYRQFDTLFSKLKGKSSDDLRRALPTAYPDARLTKLLNDCAEAEAQLARERLDKTDTHPDVRKAATTVKIINEQIASTIDGILAGLNVRVETLKGRLDEIEKQIDKLKQSGDRGSKTAGVVATTAASTERTPAEEEARDIRQLEAMFKESPDLINARGQATAGTYLHQAAQDGRLLVVEYLLNHGADVHARVTGQNASTPLHLAVESGHKAIVEMLLQHHADVNAKGLKDRTPVWLAANRGFKSIVELLLANGADVNAPDADGATPLHPAVENGFKAIAELLIEHRADVNARLADSSVNRSNSRAGATPLHLAAAKTPEVAELLLAHGAEVNSRDGMGNTPLATAVRENITAVALLLKNHADVNATNSYGVTPLHLAATYGRLEAAKLLVANGANLEARDKEGRTPLFHVNGKEIFEFLLNSGANVNALTIYNTTLADIWSTGSPNQLTTECLQILAERGGKHSDELLRPLYISVSRNPTNFKDSIFYKGTNSFNQFTLLELLAGVNWKMQSRLRFPDFSRVTIQRLDSQTKQSTEVHVDVRAILKADDCTQDVPLQWGDIVDIPESDHPVGQSFIYPDELQPTLHKCLARSVQVIVKGETNKVSLVPSVGSTLENQSRSMALAGFYLQPAIATFIRTSSDLKHIRVQRKDPSTGKMREILVNEEARPNPDLFLRDGDVILVPEKP